jgi:hypothetical protein
MRQLMDAQLVEDIGAYTGVPFTKKIEYVSLNPGRFTGTDFATMRTRECALTQSIRYYYPLDSLQLYDPVAMNGDIIGLTTNVNGLDVSHVAFVTVRKGRLKFTHASSTVRKVVIEQDLRDYLATRTTITGIVVFRPVFY